MEVKQVIVDMMKEETNIIIISSDIIRFLKKLLETREEFYANILTSLAQIT